MKWLENTSILTSPRLTIQNIHLCFNSTHDEIYKFGQSFPLFPTLFWHFALIEQNIWRQTWENGTVSIKKLEQQRKSELLYMYLNDVHSKSSIHRVENNCGGLDHGILCSRCTCWYNCRSCEPTYWGLCLHRHSDFHIIILFLILLNVHNYTYVWDRVK